MTPLAKRLAIGLSISIALNLLTAGFLLGRGLHGPGPGRKGPAILAEDLRGLRHPALRKAYERQSGDVTARRDAVRHARKAVRETLRAEPFEAAKLEGTLRQLRDETTKTQELLHRTLVEAARESAPEARRELSRGFERERRPRH
ncbi:MAG TPA: periplasmic heavy metal sensor [Polyangiaceae bacterium]|nr:periplasmic heavy metal sensor [Polyangiaceae bacterium]